MDSLFVFMDYYKLKVLNNKRIVITILVLIVIALFLVYYFLFSNHNSEEIEINEPLEVNDSFVSNPITDIFVDIKGQVNKPGVYSFKQDNNARINDLIEKAGGLTSEADTSTINLSKKLEDEMTIIIYSKKEIANYLKTQDEMKKKLEICETKLKNNACIKEKNDVVKNDKININEADINELTTIPGIGEAKAKAIIEYRNKKKFTNIDDIKNVEGIGENLFANIKESITV